MTPRPVRVLVVAYGRPDLLEATLRSLGGRLDVHVVDNSSQPAVAEVAAHCGARYTDPGRNGGFAAGVNVGIADVLTREPADLLLLNPDAELDAAAVEALGARLHAPDATRVGALSPALVDDEGRPQRVLWPFPHPVRAWVEAVGLGRFNRSPDFAVGTALLLRWEAIGDVGGFDERFFLYAEETDWQRRARDHGWTARLVPEVVARHVGGATSSDPLRRERLFHAGTETYVRKWFGPVGWQVYRAASWFGATLRAAALRGERGAAARARASVYRRGPRRAAGLEAR